MIAVVRISAVAAVLATALGSSPLHAQTPSAREAEVVAVIQKLFDAMLSRDTTALRAVFDPSARLVRGGSRDDPNQVQVTTVDQFVNSIASAPADARLIERIYEPEVRIDGNLATVWTFYTFHLGEQFSHCGIDAAQLLEINGGWKIVHLADTMRRENCEPPKKSGS
jgi:hypothetical protein